ncbi:hypothetical protein E4T50_11054 [Aureobasidium sp. EXF-12298]|nr:hypothetical protein E4T50_11054 [Aureobasidium sp. EXF-12298]
MATPSTGAVSTPDKKASAEHFQGIVTLIVGKEKKAYNLHKDLLCFYSDYFRAAFNGSFKEAAERKLELPDVEISLFDKFQVWLYTRDLQGPTTNHTESFQFLAEMWIFGDQHQIPLLQNQVMDDIFAKIAEVRGFSLVVVPEVYAKTVAGSLLRKAVIEIAGCTMDLSRWRSYPGAVGWTIECLTDLLLAVNEVRLDEKVTFPQLPKREKCFFHIHGKDEHC